MAVLVVAFWSVLHRSKNISWIETIILSKHKHFFINTSRWE